jgi:hypothetical protein
MLQKRVPKSNLLMVLKVMLVSRVAPGRLPDPKALQNEAPDMDFLLFEDLAFTFFGNTLEIFRVFHEYKIDSTQC